MRGKFDNAHRLGLAPFAEKDFRRFKSAKRGKVHLFPSLDGHLLVGDVGREVQRVRSAVDHALIGKLIPFHRHFHGGGDRLALCADGCGDGSRPIPLGGDDAVVIHFDEVCVAGRPGYLSVTHAQCRLHRSKQGKSGIARHGYFVKSMPGIVPHRHISGDQAAHVKGSVRADGRILLGGAKDVHATVIVEADLRGVLSLFIQNDGRDLRVGAFPNHFVRRNAGEHLAEDGILFSRILILFQIDLVTFQNLTAVFDNDGFNGNIHERGSNEPSARVDRQYDENGYQQ